MIHIIVSFGVEGVDVTIEEWGVFIIYLARSFGNIKLAFLVAGVQDTEFLSVGGNQNYKMTSHSKESYPALGVTYVADYSAAASEMLYSFLEALRVSVFKSEFFGYDRTKHAHTRSELKVCAVFLGESDRLSYVKALVGKSIYDHTSRAESAA